MTYRILYNTNMPLCNIPGRLSLGGDLAVLKNNETHFRGGEYL